MAHRKKGWQDYLTDAFGQHGEVKPGTNALEIGAAAQEGGAFERLPIGTSSGGTAVLVDLIGAELVSVSVGSVGINGFTGTAGTATLIKLLATEAGALNTSGTTTGVGVLADGTIGVVGTVPGIGVLADGTVDVANIVGGTQDTLGTVDLLKNGTLSVVKAGTIGLVGTVPGIGVLADGTIKKITNLAGGTVEAVNMPHSDDFGAVGTLGGTATGTIKALVSGSAIIVTDLMISSEGAATVIIGDGTPTSRLAEIFFPSGANTPITGLLTPIKTTSGSALVYSTGGGTAAVTATGYIN